MSGQELRRRLHEVDPNLKIVTGRVTRPGARVVPRVLSPTESKQWGLPEMIPIFPSEEVLVIEAMYSKKELEELCINNYLEPQGDKDRLIQKLIYVGVMDTKGRITEKAMAQVPSIAPQTYARIWNVVDKEKLRKYCEEVWEVPVTTEASDYLGRLLARRVDQFKTYLPLPLIDHRGLTAQDMYQAASALFD